MHGQDQPAPAPLTAAADGGAPPAPAVLYRARYDVICIGGGGAGVAAATAAAAAGARVAIVSKDPVGYGNTRIAGGGIVRDPDHTSIYHDVMESGEGLSSPEAVRVLVDHIDLAYEIPTSWGYRTALTPAGTPRVIQPGGHSKPRMVVSAGHGFGSPVRRGAAQSPADLFEQCMAVRILVRAGRVAGVLAYHLIDGDFYLLQAPTVAVTAGGAGQLWHPHSTNIRYLSGDAYALALRAGAELQDMEQVQWLPFCAVAPPAWVGARLGEPARMAGPHGVLLNARGDVLLDRLRERTRAAITEVMFREILYGAPGPNGGVFLDLRGNLEATGQPLAGWNAATELAAVVRLAYGADAAEGRAPFEVAPSEHTVLGGIRCDAYGRADLPGLYAAGEARGGLHGGNRLAGIGLSELFVVGRLIGERAAAEAAAWRDWTPADLVDEAGGVMRELARRWSRRDGEHPARLKNELRQAMWRYVSGLRDEAGLECALGTIRALRDRAGHVGVPAERHYNLARQDLLELDCMLDAAEAITLSALVRKESRGSHLREDFPARDDAHWRKNIVLARGAGEWSIRLEEPV